MNNNMQYQQQVQQPQQIVQPQTTYLPLTFVNGIEGAKAFIVGANQVIYLKDRDSNTLFEKRADAQGKYTLTAYSMKPIELNNVGKENKDELMYMTYNDFKKYEMRFDKALEDLQKEILSLKGDKNE
jgi:hypothetical protein